MKGHPQCWIDLQQWQWRLYITLVALSLFFLPAVIISCCYLIIVHTIWKKSKRMAFSQSASKQRKKSKPLRSNAEYGEQFESTSSRGIIPRAKIKTVKMTLVIVFVFILCYSPYFVWDLLQVYGFIPYTQTTIALSTFIQSLAPLNSAANPLIYCLFSTRFSRDPK
ncbi:cardioacceleratory peptide receptor-like protein [Dinothrombium tinctorium]|uniref:Cardioacceleratory peptide receptor-like protein n=1 Tax=Dinothrombium tinctorium TaxID=1965070 RepID=A0A443QTI8_9ACAR|nr:cardioacceleratory peptide receptor-like protein [Dinothrombium tinctorium]